MKEQKLPTDMPLDILAIGDIVIDAFIRIEDAQVIDDPKDAATGVHNPLLAFRYGDKVPYESVTVCNAVGNAANAAVSAARLGLGSALLTYVGDDQNGRDCIAELERNAVSTDMVRIEAGKKTNYHYALWYDVDRTILIRQEEFNYELGTFGIDAQQNEIQPKWIYLSSLAKNSLSMYEQIATYLDAHPNVKLAFQPGVFDMKLGVEKLHHIYSRAETVCVNVEEAQRILGETSRDLKILLSKMAALGPKKVFITDGFDGAYAHDASSPDAANDFWFIPVYPHTPFERTGAGDAFFSTVVSALALGKSVDEALRWGPINSQSVVQYVGAQQGLLSREKLVDFLTKAPAEYVAKKI